MRSPPTSREWRRICPPGAALATVVGVLIEVPVMLMLVKICLKTTHWFDGTGSKPKEVLP